MTPSVVAAGAMHRDSRECSFGRVFAGLAEFVRVVENALENR
jgi:hypothetical protein